MIGTHCQVKKTNAGINKRATESCEKEEVIKGVREIGKNARHLP